jgi:hypothetical protein
MGERRRSRTPASLSSSLKTTLPKLPRKPEQRGGREESLEEKTHFHDKEAGRVLRKRRDAEEEPVGEEEAAS